MRPARAAILTILAAVICLVLAGCSQTPAGNLNTFLGALHAGDLKAAARQSYDTASLEATREALGADVGDASRAVSVGAATTALVRKAGYSPPAVSSMADRLKGTVQDMDNRFRPLLDKANAELGNVQKERQAAEEQLVYAGITYGKHMPQYYAEQSRIGAIIPRLNAAQAKVDTLNAQYQAELQVHTSAATEQYKKDAAEAKKKLAANSVEVPAVKIAVEFGAKSSGGNRTFTVVQDSGWKVYSCEAAAVPSSSASSAK